MSRSWPGCMEASVSAQRKWGSGSVVAKRQSGVDFTLTAWTFAHLVHACGHPRPGGPVNAPTPSACSQPTDRGVPTGFFVTHGASPADCCRGSTMHRPFHAWPARGRDLSRFSGCRGQARMDAGVCRSGEIGKRAALKMRCPQGPAGSSPASGTNPCPEVSMTVERVKALLHRPGSRA
jgi:hypothetical protein